MEYAIAAVIAYFLGAVPFSWFLGRVFTGVDIRTVGSGNPGATNLFRVNKPLGVIGLLLDVGKGFFPTLLLPVFFDNYYLTFIAAALAIAGHMYTVFLGFRGGKGVATAVGAMLAVNWVIAAAAFGVFLAVMALFRYISLGSICAACSIYVLSVLIPYLQSGDLNYPLIVFCWLLPRR
ncbi:MAG: glycerol-3-phosphate acyltransferase [Candidatus Coatesbacteria bacterium]|nr:MAG: glycerol-3-phosphate acyltransferase [Candidatus Coatesbacteria bacterium]